MPLESIPCPNCTADETLERYPNLRGFWRTDSESNVKRCENCGHEEPYHPKSSRDGKEHGTTKSQDRKLAAMREFAEEHAYEEWTLETEHLDFGPMSYELELDPDSTFNHLSIHGLLSRRGKVTFWLCSRLMGTSDPMASIFARATGGHDQRDRTGDDE